MRWLPSVETKRSRSAVERSRGPSGWLARGEPYKQKWDTKRAVDDGFSRVIWIYRCIDAIAWHGARLPVVVRQGDQDEGEIVASKDLLLKRLNRRASPYLTASQFRYMVIAQLLLSKQGVFVEIIRDRSGRVAELHLLPCTHTAPIPGAQRLDGTTAFVDGYRVTDPDGAWTDLEPERVVWIRKPHPLDPYLSSTPMEAAGITVDTDFYARLFNRNFLASDGRPGGILAVKGQMDPEDAKELQRRFSGGPSQAGRTTVLEADDVEWVDTSTSPRDAQYTQSLTATKSDLLLAFGVPESVLGNAAGRCVDEATECLTQRGWVNGWQLTTDDTILSMDPVDGQLKWGPVHEVYRNAFYDGPMHRLTHKHADYLVTPGHRWAVEPRAGQGVKGFVPNVVAELRKVEELRPSDHVIVMGDAEASNWEATYSSAFVELVGWHVTEGSVDSATRVRICQNEGPHADRIRACLKESGAKWAEGQKTDHSEQRIFYVGGEIGAALNAVAPRKVMSFEFMNALTPPQRELLMQAMLDGDGSRNTGGTWVFTQKSREMADAFVYVATLAGYRTSTRHETYERTPESTSFKDVDRWRVIVTAKSRRTVTFRRPENHTVERYRGLVWCPRTDYGTMVARRHGRVFVTGQTYDNAGAEEFTFWRMTMLPILDLVQEAFDPLLEGGDEDDLFLSHDLSRVAVLQRDQREKDAKVLQDFQAGVITIDEYRVATRREPLNVPGSQVLLIPSGKVPIGKDDVTTEAAQKLMPIGTPDMEAGLGGAGQPVAAIEPGDRTDLGAGGTTEATDNAAQGRFNAANFGHRAGSGSGGGASGEGGAAFGFNADQWGPSSGFAARLAGRKWFGRKALPHPDDLPDEVVAEILDHLEALGIEADVDDLADVSG